MCLLRSRAKPMSKPLNPQAEPFHTQSLGCSSLLMSWQEPRFPLVYGHDHQLVFLPEPREAVGGFPPRYGYWYGHPSHPCSFGFCTPHTADNHGNGMYHQFVNVETLEPSHGSDHRTENIKMGSIRKKMTMSAKRNKEKYFPTGNGRKRTVVKRDQTEWRAKGTSGKPTEKSAVGCDVRRTINPFPQTMEEAESSPTTTVMIRNIPNQYKFNDLLLILDDHCCQQNKNADPAVWSKFDFVYLPMDYRKHAIEGRMSNLGYAFVNFTTASAAFKFYQRFQGLVWNVTENRKTCEINTAQFQGKEALMRIFHEKVFRCESRDFLPVVFSDARDGFNRRMEGTPVGKHVWGLPRKSIGS